MLSAVYHIRSEPDSRPAVLPELCANLVRHDETGGRADQDPLVGPLARTDPRPRPALQLARIRQGLQLPGELAYESTPQMFCLVKILYTFLHI